MSTTTEQPIIPTDNVYVQMALIFLLMFICFCSCYYSCTRCVNDMFHPDSPMYQTEP